MNKKWWVIAHVFVWAAVLALLLTPMVRFGVTQPIPYVVSAFLLYLGSFYINLHIIVPWWSKKKRVFQLLLSWLLLTLLYTLLFLLVNYLFVVYQHQRPRLILLNTFLRSSIFNGCFLITSTLYKFAIDWFRNDRLKEQLENEHLKTELAFLRSQINPHFLFNTLNNIYTLAYQQSSKTANAVMRLSGMMQYMLYDSNVEKVMLVKELAYIEQLIALQQLRMKECMSLEYSVTGHPSGYTIPPLLLIPFVENVFKHGVLNDPENPAIIHLTIDDDRLLLHTSNRINNHLKDETRGIGLVNVKRRMELLYTKASGYTIENSATHFSVHLTLQLT
jgi:two-component system LytT family sensor kinase